MEWVYQTRIKYPIFTNRNSFITLLVLLVLVILGISNQFLNFEKNLVLIKFSKNLFSNGGAQELKSFLPLSNFDCRVNSFNHLNNGQLEESLNILKNCKKANSFNLPVSISMYLDMINNYDRGKLGNSFYINRQLEWNSKLLKDFDFYNKLFINNFYFEILKKIVDQEINELLDNPVFFENKLQESRSDINKLSYLLKFIDKDSSFSEPYIKIPKDEFEKIIIDGEFQLVILYPNQIYLGNLVCVYLAEDLNIDDNENLIIHNYEIDKELKCKENLFFNPGFEWAETSVINNYPSDWIRVNNTNYSSIEKWKLENEQVSDWFDLIRWNPENTSKRISEPNNNYMCIENNNGIVDGFFQIILKNQIISENYLLISQNKNSTKGNIGFITYWENADSPHYYINIDELSDEWKWSGNQISPKPEAKGLTISVYSNEINSQFCIDNLILINWSNQIDK